jgi:hypothetical protein
MNPQCGGHVYVFHTYETAEQMKSELCVLRLRRISLLPMEWPTGQ